MKRRALTVGVHIIILSTLTTQSPGMFARDTNVSRVIHVRRRPRITTMMKGNEGDQIASVGDLVGTLKLTKVSRKLSLLPVTQEHSPVNAIPTIVICEPCKFIFNSTVELCRVGRCELVVNLSVLLHLLDRLAIDRQHSNWQAEYLNQRSFRSKLLV